MESVNRVFLLLKKDITLEFRSLYAVGSILLYVVTTVFIVYKTFNVLQPRTWNSMFWILFIFASINVSLRSFSKMSSENQLFNYSYLDPSEFIISKIIFNLLFLIIIAVLTFTVMSVFFPHPVEDFMLFCSGTLMAILGVSIIMTFSSAASNQGSSNAAIMSVMSLPLTLPILHIAIKISLQAMNQMNDTTISTDYMLLGGNILLMLGVTILLFPYLWKS